MVGDTLYIACNSFGILDALRTKVPVFSSEWYYAECFVRHYEMYHRVATEDFDPDDSLPDTYSLHEGAEQQVQIEMTPVSDGIFYSEVASN